MSIYDLIHQFIRDVLINTSTALTDIGFTLGSDNYTVYMDDWLAHTLTIIILVLFVVALIKLVIWVFKLGANIVRIR
jgi:hypothetical protein